VQASSTSTSGRISQRVTRLVDLYDVDFGEKGVLGIGTFSTVRIGTHKTSGIK